MKKYKEALFVSNLKARTNGLWFVREINSDKFRPLTTEPAQSFIYQRSFNGALWGYFQDFPANHRSMSSTTKGHCVRYDLYSDVRPDLNDVRLPAEYATDERGVQFKELLFDLMNDIPFAPNSRITASYVIRQGWRDRYLIDVYIDGRTRLRKYPYNVHNNLWVFDYKGSEISVRNKPYGHIRSTEIDTIFDIFDGMKEKRDVKTWVKAVKWMQNLDVTSDAFKIKFAGTKFQFIDALRRCIFEVQRDENGFAPRIEGIF